MGWESQSVCQWFYLSLPWGACEDTGLGNPNSGFPCGRLTVMGRNLIFLTGSLGDFRRLVNFTWGAGAWPVWDLGHLDYKPTDGVFWELQNFSYFYSLWEDKLLNLCVSEKLHWSPSPILEMRVLFFLGGLRIACLRFHNKMLWMGGLSSKHLFLIILGIGRQTLGIWASAFSP